MNTRFNSWILPIVIVMLSLLPFLWLPKNYMINSEEQLFMNYDILLDKASHAWTNFSAHGLPATAANHSLIIPNAYFYKFFRTIGLPMDTTQKLFISFCILSLLVSFWLFATLLTKKKYVILLGLLAFFLNFYVAIAFTFTGKIFQMILTPLLFYITYKYFETKKTLYLAAHFVAFFTFQAIFTNLPQLFGLLPIYIFAVIFYRLHHNEKNLTIVKHFMVYTFIVTPIYFYHALVYYFALFVHYEFVKEVILSAFTALVSDTYKMFQLRGVWWEDANAFTDVPYYRWSSFFNHPLIVFISFLLPIVTFYIVFVRNKASKTSVFFLILYLFYFVAATGAGFFPPLYTWLFRNIPYFSIFREPWPKFTPGVILGLSSLALLALDRVNLSSKHYKILYYFLLALILIRGYPFFSPQFYTKWKNDLSNIPHYWVEYREWTSTQNESKIFPIPFSSKIRFEFVYDWPLNKLGKSDTEMPFVFSASSVIRPYDNDFFSSLVISSLSKKNFDFVKIGKVDYVLLQNDLKPVDKSNTYSWQKSVVKNYFQEKPHISFGNKLFLHKIKPEYEKSTVYIPKKITKTMRADNLLDMDLLSSVQPNTVIFPIYENSSKIQYVNNLDADQLVIPRLEYQKINPTKYRIQIHHAQKPFVLILGESFDVGWKVHPDRTSLFVEDSRHLLANGFLNSWVLDPVELCKVAECRTNPDKSLELELIIEYWPQILFNYVFYFNLFLFLTCSTYILFRLIVNHHQKHSK